MSSQPPLVEHSLENTALRCKGKADTNKATNLGWYFGRINIRDQVWAMVIWDRDREPEFYKPKLLLIEQQVWRPL